MRTVGFVLGATSFALFMLLGFINHDQTLVCCGLIGEWVVLLHWKESE